MLVMEAESELRAEVLAEEIVDRYRSMMRSKAGLLEMIGEFDRRGLAQECGASSTATWLMRRLGISESSAHEYVYVARQLLNFPYLAEMFAAGNLSYSALRLLLKYLTPENEVELVEKGMELGHNGLECALAGREKAGDDKPKKEYYLRMAKEDDGDLTLWARLNHVDGDAFCAALKIGHLAFAASEEELSSLIGEDGYVDPAKLDALIKAKEEEEEKMQAKKDVSGFGLPTGRAMVHALMGMVNAVRSQPQSKLRAPGAQVSVMATLDGRAYLPNNAGVASEGLANLVANALVRLDTVDDRGLIINAGRSTRLATDGQIRSLLAMWGGQCAMPGCTHTRFMEFHHMQEWANGGLTDMDNLIPLCSACHSLVTEGYAEITRHGDEIVFDFGDGSRYVSYNHSLPVRNDSYVMPKVEKRGCADSFAS